MSARDIIPIVIGVLLLGWCAWVEYRHIERVVAETRRLLEEYARSREKKK
jgi:hypothetical protein